LKFYNDFWLPHFVPGKVFQPNDGHLALEAVKELFPQSCHIITQNIDALQVGVLEAHGRVGLYKCIPEEDSDTDSDEDENDDRLVHLGHRRKSRALRRMILEQEEAKENASNYQQPATDMQQVRGACRYQQVDSIRLEDIEPVHVRQALLAGKTILPGPPLCPLCHRPVPPQALLFDEGYHSHDFYRFEEIEEILGNAEVLVFVGTSFNVRITEVALDHARDHSLPVFNFNIQDVLEPSVRLNVENIVGKSCETLPILLQHIRDLLEGRTEYE
jgi:NAD-dependent SIR2 family protein deacetylase